MFCTVKQLHTTLRFYAMGNKQVVDGDLMGIDQLTACRLIHRMTKAIASRNDLFICFPNGGERNMLKGQFYAVAGFPNFVGVIDGSHIPIQKPKGNNSELYRCRNVDIAGW